MTPKFPSQDTQLQDYKSYSEFLMTQPSSSLTIVQAQELVVRWADSTFPNRNYKTAISKIMLEELPEFLQDPTPGEWADVMILWLDVAHLLGINPVKALTDKMDTNSKRVFKLDKESGLYHHI